MERERKREREREKERGRKNERERVNGDDPHYKFLISCHDIHILYYFHVQILYGIESIDKLKVVFPDLTELQWKNIFNIFLENYLNKNFQEMDIYYINHTKYKIN